VLGSPDVIALLLAASGVLALGLGTLAMRGFGPGFRIGRILRAAPEVTLTEVEEAARAGRRVYVRAHGRISSDEEFPDEHDRPLVYRRRRVQLGGRSGWEAIEDEREAVPFGIASRGVQVDVDVDVLDEGLVVLPRESRGTAGEVPEHAPAGASPDRAMRLLIEQVSAVEHAFVAGVPTLGPGGRPMLTAGNGRPLVVCTLELPEAMRVLGGANRTRAAGAAALLAAGGLLLVGALALALAGPVLARDGAPVLQGVTAVRAAPSAFVSASAFAAAPPAAGPAAAADVPAFQPASPAIGSPQPGASAEAVAGGDTRSSGTPPSFVGQPVLAAVAVVLLGIVVAGAATLYVRLTQPR
jgi:hypothetical protein